MLRRSKSLSRCYLGAYLVWLFAGWIPPFLAYKYSIAMTIVFTVFTFLILACLIVSHVFKNKNNLKLFIPTSCPAFMAITLYIVIGTIYEAVYTAQGHMAIYPWVIEGIAIAIFAAVIPFLFINYHRALHPIDYSVHLTAKDETR